MTQAERVKELRKTLDLTLEKFGEKLGVGKTAISNIETGNRNLTEQMKKLICKSFNVDYLWLTTGEGDMFIDIPDTIIDELCLQHNLDAIDKAIIKQYVEYPADQRAAIKNFIKNLAGAISEKE